MKDENLNKNIVQNLADMYFQGFADEISNEYRKSVLHSNMGDRGDIRENVLLRFLENHLPARSVIVKGGCIFDSDGNESKQIDILIASDSSLRFSYDRNSERNKVIQTIEGCLAAISVKSTLNKKNLVDALSNLASIPPMPQYMLQNVSPSLAQREKYLKLPLKIVFAYTGGKVISVLKNINEFYSNNSCHEYQKTDLIIINNSFCIERVPKGGGKTKDGSVVSEGLYHPMYNQGTKKFGALPLLRLLIHIQQYCNWTPHVILEYHKYFDAMNFHD